MLQPRGMLGYLNDYVSGIKAKSMISFQMLTTTKWFWYESEHFGSFHMSYNSYHSNGIIGHHNNNVTRHVMSWNITFSNHICQRVLGNLSHGLRLKSSWSSMDSNVQTSEHLGQKLINHNTVLAELSLWPTHVIILVTCQQQLYKTPLITKVL